MCVWYMHSGGQTWGLLSHPLPVSKDRTLLTPELETAGVLVILSWKSQAFCNSNLLAGYNIICLTYMSENTFKNQKVATQVLYRHQCTM